MALSLGPQQASTQQELQHYLEPRHSLIAKSILGEDMCNRLWVADNDRTSPQNGGDLIHGTVFFRPGLVLETRIGGVGDETAHPKNGAHAWGSSEYLVLTRQ